MNHDEIIQIIPAPEGMYAKYAGEDNGEEYESHIPIVCLALVEQDGYRYVQAVDMDSTGLSSFPEEMANFECILWKEN